jgi:hypothetical protein
MVNCRRKQQNSKLTWKKPLKIVVVNVEHKLKKTRMSKSKLCKSNLRKILRKKGDSLKN